MTEIMFLYPCLGRFVLCIVITSFVQILKIFADCCVAFFSGYKPASSEHSDQGNQCVSGKCAGGECSEETL